MTPVMNAWAAAEPAIDIIVESALWRAQPDAEATVRRALTQAAAAMSTGHAELAVVLTDNSAIRTLNREWRGIDEPTNVLSFPARPADPARKQAREAGGAPGFLGDIVLAYETVAQEAAADGKPFDHHLAHLAVHGFLHLLGFDHEHDNDAEAMEELELKILARLNVADPYRQRDART